MSGNASFSARTFFQLSDGNLWQVEHSSRCAFELCSNWEYFRTEEFLRGGVGETVACSDETAHEKASEEKLPYATTAKKTAITAKRTLVSIFEETLFI